MKATTAVCLPGDAADVLVLGGGGHGGHLRGGSLARLSGHAPVAAPRLSRLFLHHRTGTFGDLALARNLDNGRRSAAIVADAGPRDAGLGEVSIRLAENLGGKDVDPRNGAGMPNGRLVYVVFPESKERPAWPVEVSRLEARAGELLDAVGGWERILACVP